LVVDATGRRSPIDDWLTQAGARTTATWRAECGIAYFSRHYRVRQGCDLPAPLVTRTVVALDEFLVGKWGGDNGTVQLVVAPLSADRRFRTLRDPRVFTAVLRTIPLYAAWLDVMDPLTGVFPWIPSASMPRIPLRRRLPSIISLTGPSRAMTGAAKPPTPNPAMTEAERPRCPDHRMTTADEGRHERPHARLGGHDRRGIGREPGRCR
jgi:hypothetical protein